MGAKPEIQKLSWWRAGRDSTRLLVRGAKEREGEGEGEGEEKEKKRTPGRERRVRARDELPFRGREGQVHVGNCRETWRVE
jgi:hypothetical protein